MNAPLLFMLLPSVASLLAFLLFSWRPRLVVYLVTALSLFLAWLSLSLPLDVPLRVWNFSVPISRTFALFGRQFIFNPSMRPALFFLFIGCAALFGGSLAISHYRRFLPVGLVVQSLLTASLFVEPFLYAAVFLLLAVACLSLLLSDSTHPEPRGATRWIIFTALGVPFLLLAGTELAFRSGQPIDASQAQPIILLLSIGFGLFLSFPPFHFWLPDVADDSPPYSVAFVLSVYVGAVIFFLLRFLDEFAWLRSSPETYQILQGAGTAMCIVGGLLALTQSRLGRMFGYLSLVNLGAILLGLSVAKPVGVEIAIVMLATRGFSLIVWGMSFQAIRSAHAGDDFVDLRGRAGRSPFSCAAVVLAGLSLAGLPGLISFPGYYGTLRALADASLPSQDVFFPLVVLLLSMAAGTIACLRFARVMLEAPIGWPLQEEGSRLYRLILGLACMAFFFFGLLPQLFLPWIANSAQAFTNLMGIN
jgi:NADH:ubiquinone oxidoreductase subunit 2 (subunit N)